MDFKHTPIFKAISILVIIALLIAFDPAPQALAQIASSLSYKLDSSSQDNGGSPKNSLSAKVKHESIGQALAQKSASSSYKLSSGFIPIIQSNPPQLINNIPNFNWQENASLADAFDLDDYFVSPDGYALTYIVSGNSNITVDIAQTTNLVSFSQAQAWFGTEEVIFTATDTEGNSLESNPVSLQAEGVDNPPVLDFINNITAIETELIKLTPNATDLDNDIVTYTYSTPLDSSGKWQTDYSSSGTYIVTVTATDPGGLDDSQDVTITVNNVNRLPALEEISDMSASEGDIVTITPQASDPDQEAIVFYYSSPLDTSGKWLTGYDDEGNYPITVTASDGIDTVSESFTLTVNNTNRPPKAALTLSDYTINPNDTITITINASDPDGDTLSFVLNEGSSQIASGALINGSYSATASFSSDCTISAIVTDFGGLSDTAEWDVDVVDPNANRDAINPVMGDFNGDSLSDLGMHNSDSGEWEVCLSDEGQFKSAQTWLSGFGTSREWIPVGGDFNADARTDVGLYNNTTGELEVALSTGSSFARDAAWLTFTEASYDWQPLTGNFNGDKYTDFGVYNKKTGEIRIALGRAGGFSGFTTWLNSFGGSDEWILLPGDFNGDSLTDISIFKKTSGEFKVAFSTSKGFMPKSNTWITDFATDYDPLIADFNNDGFADIGFWDKSSTWNYAITRGNNFVNKGAWLSGFGSGSAETAHTGDYNGDGITDAAVFDRDSQGIDRWDTRIIEKQPVDLLVGIDNGIGGVTDITYQFAAKFNNDLLPFPVYVAKTISVTDTIGDIDETYIQNFDYAGGWYDSVEREFRGFRTTTVTDPITGNFTETYFFQGKDSQGGGALKGKIEKLYAYDGNNRLISGVENVWDVASAGSAEDGLGFPYLKELTTTVTEENGSSITTRNKMFYDAIGNVTQTINEGDVSVAGDEKQSYTEYNPAYAEGFNRPKQATLRDIDENVYSKKEFDYDDYGNLTQESVYVFEGALDGDYQVLSTNYSYDSFGNLTQTTNPKNSIVTTDYETNFYTFPERVTNSLGHTITYEYNTRLGVVTKVTDANGSSSESVYDSLGRVIRSKNGFGQTVTTYTYPDFNTKIIKQWARQASPLQSTQYIDGLGRNYKTITQGEDGNVARDVITETFFNNRGLKEAESLPHYVGSDPADTAYVRYEYDIRGRIKKTISDFPGMAKDAQSSISYLSPLYTETTDPKGHRKGVTKDVYGNNIKITEFTQAGAYDTHYDYDIQANLIKTTDTQGNITRIAYDSLGRKLSMNDPDMGVWSYEYDSVGNLIKQTDAKGQVLEFEYDIINRLIAKAGVTYHYDDTSKDYCIGRLSKVVDNSGQTEFFYDKLGREIKSTKTIGSTAYTVQRTYDILDRLINLTYPDSTVVTYSYDINSGYLEKVTTDYGLSTTDYVKDITYDAQGKIKTIQYGNNTQTDYTYGSDLRLSKILTANQSETLQNLNYNFDKNGNLTTLSDNLNSNIRSYQYDDLDRLTQAQNIPDSGSYSNFTYQYDPIGNMTYKSDVGVMAYGEGAGPHAVTTAGGTSYLYDANGNMTQGKGKSFTYDTENRLTTVNHGLSTTTFTYDGDGGRVKKTTDGRETTYIGSLYELRTTDDGLQTVKHIFAGSNKVCTIEPDQTYYIHSDHLGSSNVITNAADSKISQTEYQPYGKVSEETSDEGRVTNYLFTGKELDSTGLYYYGARYYDPDLGRFISADSIIQSPYDPQTFNRYTYCRNNPLKYVDPSGRIWFIAAIIGAIIGGALGGASAAKAGIPIWKGILAGAVSGALMGGCGAALGAAVAAGSVALGTGIAAMTGLGAVAGAGSSAIMGGNIAYGAALGALGGGLGFGLGGAFTGGFTANAFMGGLSASVITGSIVGGVGSELYGGSFGQGAIVGAGIAAVAFFAGYGMARAYGGYKNNKANNARQSLKVEKASQISKDQALTFREVSLDNSEVPSINQKIYRVFGGKAKWDGKSWTPENPNSTADYRAQAGLPNANTGRFVAEARITKIDGIIIREAAVIYGNGDVHMIREYEILNPSDQLTLDRVSGANPEF